jgi:cell division protein FtsB
MKPTILALVAALAATSALADAPKADHIAAVLTRHLNAHGKHFVAGEAKRLAIGDASESGAKDDVREACPHPASCFDTSKMSPDEVMAAMLLLSAQREQTLLEQQLARIGGRNEELKRLVTALQGEPDRDRQAELRAQIEKLNADSQLDMIQLQSLINRHNQAQEMLANTLQKFQKTLDGIVRNMR